MQTDLLIIGGGINGAGIARDAAGRGLSVVLCEQSDLASATSSASSKLIHGGLRYLEQAEFRLVHESLSERETLQKIAPHLVSPMQFIMPQDPKIRSAWLIRIGLFLYNFLASNSSLPHSRALALDNSIYGVPLKKNIHKAFSYYDCRVDDARLVIANALSAREMGAKILTRTQFVTAHRHKDHWSVTLRQADNTEITVQAKCIINTAGPWVKEVAQLLDSQQAFNISLVKGSHIIVPQLYSGDHAYLLQNEDKRIIFLIPFQGKFTLIGTTDVNYTGNPAAVKISAEEIDYLCHNVNRYLNTPISTNNIVHSWSGVRTLQSDSGESLAKLSRDYEFILEADKNQAPLLSVIGGKITTYRRLAEHALKQLQPFFNYQQNNWTANSPLAGGNMSSFNELKQSLLTRYPNLDPRLLERYAHTYGSLSYPLLTDVTAMADLGLHFGAGLYQREVEYLIQHEWAQTAEDILWRRTKLGLFFSSNEIKALENFLATRQSVLSL